MGSRQSCQYTVSSKDSSNLRVRPWDTLIVGEIWSILAAVSVEAQLLLMTEVAIYVYALPPCGNSGELSSMLARSLVQALKEGRLL